MHKIQRTGMQWGYVVIGISFSLEVIVTRISRSTSIQCKITLLRRSSERQLKESGWAGQARRGRDRTPPYSAQALMPNARKMDPRRGNSHAKIPKKWQFEPTNPHARDARKMTDLGELSCGHARKIVTIRTRSRNR